MFQLTIFFLDSQNLWRYNHGITVAVVHGRPLVPPVPGAFGAFPSVLCPQHRGVGAAQLRAQLVAAALGAGGAAALGAGAAAVRATEAGGFSKGICRIPKKTMGFNMFQQCQDFEMI